MPQAQVGWNTRTFIYLKLQVDYSEEVLCHRRYDIPPALCHNVDHKVREYNFILLKILIMMKDLPQPVSPWGALRLQAKAVWQLGE